MLQIISLAETRLSSDMCRTLTDLQVLKQNWNNMIGVSVLGVRNLFSQISMNSYSLIHCICSLASN